MNPRKDGFVGGDEIDRQIDEALSLAVAGEPLRVSAASTRAALAEPRRSRPPLWFGVAAVLLVGIALALVGRSRVVQAPDAVPRSVGPEVAGEARPDGSLAPSPTAFVEVAPRTTVRAAVAGQADYRRGSFPEEATEGIPEAAYEGLPPLSIAMLETPAALSIRDIDPGAIRIAAIEIAPLSVPTLSNE